MTGGERLSAEEVVAFRRLLHRGAEAVVGDDTALEMNPVEKADAITRRLESMEEDIEEVKTDVYLFAIFRGDGPTKRANKVQIMRHVIDKAERTRTGRSHLKTEVASTIADVSRRQARTYMDEIAEDTPGVHVAKAEAVGEGKQLRIDLQRFNEGRSPAEALPPREES